MRGHSKCEVTVLDLSTHLFGPLRTKEMRGEIMYRTVNSTKYGGDTCGQIVSYTLTLAAACTMCYGDGTSAQCVSYNLAACTTVLAACTMSDKEYKNIAGDIGT